MSIRKSIGRILNILLFWKFPYIKHIKFLGRSYLFKIHSRVEEYRIVKFGGEKDYILRILGCLKKRGVFYDTGASVGLITVLASKVVTEGKVVAFEPDQETFQNLNENININKCKNIIAFPYALSDKNKSIKLYTQGSNNYSPSIKPVQGYKKFIKVKGVMMDNIIKLKKLPLPDALKIDVEGSEMQVLLGMDKLLISKNKPKHIFIEIHPVYIKEFGYREEDVLRYLKKKSYKIKWNQKRDDEHHYHLTS